MRTDLQGSKERFSKFFEKKNQALIYTKGCRVYFLDALTKSLVHSLMSEIAMLFWERELPWNSLLEKFDHNRGDNIPSQHQEWADVTSDNPRLLRKEALYWDEGTPGAGKSTMRKAKPKNVS